MRRRGRFRTQKEVEVGAGFYLAPENLLYSPVLVTDISVVTLAGFLVSKFYLMYLHLFPFLLCNAGSF